MRKSKCNKKCICGNTMIYYGWQNGRHKYKCKHCKKIIVEKEETPKYERHEVRVLAMLFQLLNNNFYNQEQLSEAFKSTKDYYDMAAKVQFDTHLMCETENKNQNIKINCYNPKLLICADHKKITFIQIPPANFQNPNNNEQRTITIIDNKSLDSMVYETNEHYTNYIKEP